MTVLDLAKVFLEHYVTSAFLGYAVYLLTSTILLDLCRDISQLRSTRLPQRAVEYFIYPVSICWGLLASWSAHIMVDYYIGHFVLLPR